MNEPVNTYQLDMNLGEFNRDSNLRSSNQFASNLTFDHKKGYFVSRWMLIVTAVSFICSLITIGLLVKYLSPCYLRPEDIPDEDGSDTGPTKIAARLPNNLKPLLYQLSIQPYIVPNLFYFNGNVCNGKSFFFSSSSFSFSSFCS